MVAAGRAACPCSPPATLPCLLARAGRVDRRPHARGGCVCGRRGAAMGRPVLQRLRPRADLPALTTPLAPLAPAAHLSASAPRACMYISPPAARACPCVQPRGSRRGDPQGTTCSLLPHGRPRTSVSLGTRTQRVVNQRTHRLIASACRGKSADEEHGTTEGAARAPPCCRRTRHRAHPACPPPELGESIRAPMYGIVSPNCSTVLGKVVCSDCLRCACTTAGGAWPATRSLQTVQNRRFLPASHPRQ
jgi:hypothetical protein